MRQCRHVAAALALTPRRTGPGRKGAAAVHARTDDDQDHGLNVGAPDQTDADQGVAQRAI